MWGIVGLAEKFWDVVVNKVHVLVAVIYSGGLATYVMHSGKDIPSGLQNVTYAFFAFLAGHNFTNQKYPDPPTPADPNGTNGGTAEDQQKG
jgi:hypothetical protein